MVPIIIQNRKNKYNILKFEKDKIYYKLFYNIFKIQMATLFYFQKSLQKFKKRDRYKNIVLSTVTTYIDKE